MYRYRSRFLALFEQLEGAGVEPFWVVQQQVEEAHADDCRGCSGVAVGQRAYCCAGQSVELAQAFAEDFRRERGVRLGGRVVLADQRVEGQELVEGAQHARAESAGSPLIRAVWGRQQAGGMKPRLSVVYLGQGDQCCRADGHGVIRQNQGARIRYVAQPWQPFCILGVADGAGCLQNGTPQIATLGPACLCCG
jgi:hypothetical protein